MSGLILKLRPREELLINGALLENGDRNAKVRIKTEGAHILRMRDALRPEQADTPLKKAYYIAQLAVTGEIANTEAAQLLHASLSALAEDDLRRAVAQNIAAGNYYQVMRCLRPQALDIAARA